MLAAKPQTYDEDDVEDTATKEVFASYTCTSLEAVAPHAIRHPGDIAEPASLAAISLPPTNYPLLFPREVIASGKLSQLQLEGIVHACTKHLEWLPSGERAGFFIGDGAGVGKGRQIAGIIVDAYCRGLTKSVWCTTSTDLYADAVRDFRDLGAVSVPMINNLQSLDAAKVTPTEGCMFVTYATLTSVQGGRPRLKQLIDWLGGPSFQGVVVYDEAHKAKHHSEKEGQGTKVAAAVIELQRALPAARVVYCSATGVSEVGNMAYMRRLGLFGPGSSFPTFPDFLASLKRKGISFLELLAMELKAMGFYVARGLSFRSAEFSEIEVALTERQRQQYDAATAAWGELRSALMEASLVAGGSSDPWRPFWAAQQRFFKLLCVSMKVPAVVEEAKRALEAGHCVVVGLQSTGESAADALNLRPGDSCGFVSVCKEIMLQFVANHFPTLKQRDQGNRLTGSTAAGLATSSTTIAGGNNNINEEEKEEEDQQAVTLKQRMLCRIQELDLPPNFLDELIDKLGGKHQIAEMTGRKGRVVRDARGAPVYELRARPDSSEMDSLNIREKDLFMKAKKVVAIVSDAASTGISLHASAEAANQRRRIHLTIELPWSADKAIQQLGRSHRSNQVSAPSYKLVFTELGGERRFAAAVARRLQSLGALTRGDRRAASGLDMTSLNYDSPLGRKALRRMYDAFVEQSPLLPAGVKLEEVLEGLPEDDVASFSPRADAHGRITAAALVDAVQSLHAELRGYVDMMGIGLGAQPRNDTVAEDTKAAGSSSSAAAAAGGAGGGTGSSARDVGDVRRFLNRLLAVPTKRQRLLFNYFQLSLDSEIRAAKAAGAYTEGVSDLPGQRISRNGPPQVLWTDPLSGLVTLRHELAVDRGSSFDAALARYQHDARPGDKSSFCVSRRLLPGSGRFGVLLALQKPGHASTFTVIRPNTGESFFEMDIEELDSKYRRATPEDAKHLWEEGYETSLQQCSHGPACQAGAECHVGRRLTQVSILTGSVVRIWDVLERVLARHEAELSKADRTMRIVRVESVCATSDPDLQSTNQGTDGHGQMRSSSNGPPLIGLRYPGRLLPEVVAMLTEAQGAQERGAVTGATVESGSKGTMGLDGTAVDVNSGARGLEKPLPVNERALKKAFTAPKTVMDFFRPKPKPQQRQLREKSQEAFPLSKKTKLSSAVQHHVRGGNDTMNVVMYDGNGANAAVARLSHYERDTASLPPRAALVSDLDSKEAERSSVKVPCLLSGGPPTTATTTVNVSTSIVGRTTHGVAAGASRQASGELVGGGCLGGVGRQIVKQSLGAIEEMGFARSEVERALWITNGDVNRALELLLAGSDTRRDIG